VNWKAFLVCGMVFACTIIACWPATGTPSVVVLPAERQLLTVGGAQPCVTDGASACTPIKSGCSGMACVSQYDGAGHWYWICPGSPQQISIASSYRKVQSSDTGSWGGTGDGTKYCYKNEYCLVLVDVCDTVTKNGIITHLCIKSVQPDPTPPSDLQDPHIETIPDPNRTGCPNSGS
jgi:hypothetical protein